MSASHPKPTQTHSYQPLVARQLEKRHETPGSRAQDDHEPRRRLPHKEQEESGAGEGKVSDTLDPHGPDWIVERSQKQPDHGGVDAGKGRTHPFDACTNALLDGKRVLLLRLGRSNTRTA
jgi:hypothetical protein